MRTANAPQPHTAIALYNPLEPYCEVCEAVNTVYRHGAPEAEVVMPDHLGLGFYRKALFRNSIQLSVTSISFCKEIVLHGGGTPPQFPFNLLFCLGHDLEWQNGALARRCALREGEAILHQGLFVDGRWTIPEGFKLASVEISLDEDVLRELLPGVGHSRALWRLLAGKDGGNPVVLSGSLRRILEDVISCPLAGVLRRLYLEAKSLELLARYLHERMGENPGAPARIPLSRADMQQLRQVRSFIDADISNAPSLRELAKMAGLNECKLKAGFKALFGIPVHAYIIDKRLDTARLLLEKDGVDVTTAARNVGYTELGYFSRRFKDKFGLSPSAYRKRTFDAMTD